jgi:hypothetical protein
MSSIYKILCEVKWLHEYYLTLENGETVFGKPLQTDRLDFLYSRFVKDLPSINEDLQFLPTTYEDLFGDYKIRLIPSYSGFKVAVKCRKELLNNGTIVYTPFVPVTDTLCFRIMISETQSLNRFSVETSSNPLRTRWYFSNNNLPFVRTFPFLSSPVPAFVAGQSYAQGELATHAGIVKTFLNNGAPDPWLNLTGSHYINSSDSCILDLAFSYRFKPIDNITVASFSLKDSTNTVVKKIDVTSDHPMQTVQIDLHTSDNLVNTIKNQVVEAGNIYKLEVTGSNGYARTYTGLIFTDDVLHMKNYAGIIDLVVRPADPAFHLIDGTGRLHTRILPNGTRQPHPVFELWMKSKLPYWRYYNNKQRKIKLSPVTQDLLTDNSGVLISKNPVPMTYTPVKLKKPDNSFHLLPNPHLDTEVNLEGSNLFLQIQVPESTIFPLV